jgi:hypothetical protein
MIGMKNSLLLIFLLFVRSSASTQAVARTDFINDANGQPLQLKINYRAEGSPYLFEEYRKATIILLNGQFLADIMVKLNAVDNTVQFLSDKGVEMKLVVPAREINFGKVLIEGGMLENLVFVNAGAINSSEAPLYQLLDTGKASLLKLSTISYKDEKKYSEAGITRIFERKDRYYMLAGGRLNPVSANKASVLELLPEHRQQVEEFIDASRLKLKREADLKAVFHFYNALVN